MLLEKVAIFGDCNIDGINTKKMGLHLYDKKIIWNILGDIEKNKKYGAFYRFNWCSDLCVHFHASPNALLIVHLFGRPFQL
jgi:hypothetical protein